jgi:hypothetical protein
MARTIVSTLMFTSSKIALITGMVSPTANKDPDFITYAKQVADLRWRQLLRSCNDGDPNHPRFVG